MRFHVADLMFSLNYVINIAHLHRYIKLQNVKKYKNLDNMQVTIIFLHNFVLTVNQIKDFFFVIHC